MTWVLNEILCMFQCVRSKLLSILEGIYVLDQFVTLYLLVCIVIFIAFPNAPRNFSVIVVTTTTLQFSWTAPISSPDYLPVTGYVVICDSSVESYHVTVLESPASIMAVSPYTDYYCCVSANSSRGESPNVTCLSVETPDDGECVLSH